MKIYSVYDREFQEYGRVLDGDFSELLSALARTECPDGGTIYVPSDPALEKTAVAATAEREIFGGLPVQTGYCNGHNQELNCLEYHKNSEVNITEGDMILLLGRLPEVKNGAFDTAKTKAFLLPAGKGAELYATTLHYAPCGVRGSGFRVAVLLPRGTNLEKPQGAQDPLLWASNKWLLAHPASAEAKQGAYVGLMGENIEV